MILQDLHLHKKHINCNPKSVEWKKLFFFLESKICGCLSAHLICWQLIKSKGVGGGGEGQGATIVATLEFISQGSGRTFDSPRNCPPEPEPASLLDAFCGLNYSCFSFLTHLFPYFCCIFWWQQHNYNYIKFLNHLKRIKRATKAGSALRLRPTRQWLTASQLWGKYIQTTLHKNASKTN